MSWLRGSALIFVDETAEEWLADHGRGVDGAQLVGSGGAGRAHGRDDVGCSARRTPRGEHRDRSSRRRSVEIGDGADPLVEPDPGTVRRSGAQLSLRLARRQVVGVGSAGCVLGGDVCGGLVGGASVDGVAGEVAGVVVVGVESLLPPAETATSRPANTIRITTSVPSTRFCEWAALRSRRDSARPGDGAGTVVGVPQFGHLSASGRSG